MKKKLPKKFIQNLPLSSITCSIDLSDTAAIWPSVEKTTKPARTDVAQLIVLVINASL
jgi:hypothetical protein